MTPIINPWFFYWIDIVSNLDAIAIFITVVGCFALVALAIIIPVEIYNVREYLSCSQKEAKNLPTHIKLFKQLIIITLISILVGIITPSTKTLTKMLIAQNVTYERVEMATDTVQTVYEDIMTLFEEKTKDE